MFWGDERFVPSDSPDRNDAPAERLLFAAAPFSAAHRATRCRLRAASTARTWTPRPPAMRARCATIAGRPTTARCRASTWCCSGVGPDGHCCSLFPDHPSARDLSAAVIAVRDSPKPPPLRLSLSFDALNTANEIWVVASGSGKADAVAAALAPGADREHVPSAGARGRERTVWLLDADAAAKLPD